VGPHPRNVLFLAADAFGVLPPIARLTPSRRCTTFFLLHRQAGRDRGRYGRDPVPEFSACFGAPFLPLARDTYAEMLARVSSSNKTACWLSTPAGAAENLAWENA